MTISEKVSELEAKLKGVVEQVNQLEATKTQLTQEALRLDGAIRELRALVSADESTEEA